MNDLPKIVSGPVSIVYKGRELPIEGRLMDVIEGWQSAYNSEVERHKKALEKLESDMDKIMGIT